MKILTQRVIWLTYFSKLFVDICCCSVAKSCLILCDPRDCSTLSFPVLHYLPRFAQTHVHWISDAISPSHPLLPPSHFDFSPCQHHTSPVSQLFVAVGQSIGASALHQSFSPSNEWASLVAQTVKRLPTMWETWVQSLGQEDPLEKEMATHSSILASKIPLTEDPGRLQSMGSQRVRHDWVTSLSFFPFPMNIQGWFPVEFTDLTSLLSKGLLLRVSLAP